MKKRKSLMRWLSLILILASVSASSGFAQGSKPSTTTQKTSPAQSVNDELLKAAEKAIAEAESLRQVKSLQQEQIDALQSKITALTDLLRIERERAEAYKTAAAERATANTLDDARIKIFELSLQEFRAEVDRLRKERDSARRQRNLFTVAGIVIGALAALVGAR